MRSVKSLFKLWWDMIAAGFTTFFLSQNIFGSIDFIWPKQTNTNWNVFALVSFIVFAVLVYARVFSYKNQLDRRNERRRIANQLARFLMQGEQLQARAADATQAVSLDDVEAWMTPVYAFLRDNCGLANAQLFTQMDLRQPPPYVEGFASEPQENIFRQVAFRMGNLRTILERYTDT
jgi:hypothetical protein